MSEKTNVNQSEDVQDNSELDSTRPEADTRLLTPTDFVFEVNGDIYNEERIR